MPHAARVLPGRPSGELRFPLDEPIPYELIARIVKQHVKLDAQAAKDKKTRNKST